MPNEIVLPSVRAVSHEEFERMNTYLQACVAKIRDITRVTKTRIDIEVIIEADEFYVSIVSSPRQSERPEANQLLKELYQRTLSPKNEA
jgi:hypothetical protein